MTALFLYGAVLLMVASVIVNRVGQRRMAKARKTLTTEETALRDLDSGIIESARAVNQSRQRTAELDDQIQDMRLAVEHLTEKLDQARAAPMERYFIFDRLDARPGTIWSLDVRRAQDAPNEPRLAAAWPVPRTYLMVASNPREAMDRAAQRFPRNQGFEVGSAASCHLFKSRRDDGEGGAGVFKRGGGAA
ncbi:hypothetical protein ACIU1J_04155 [Azospirillum doebereinerae]|uniref:hypothetical protein n=1 Tax=Azospirillum doebereinerae TaxID=92933 RepID=UPI001EE506F7|nr:hypothetical protein [Azospirillum doebereinerae]MCG5243256.1 hypothetical protein [Azospirillum doebereinerae]